MFYDNPAEFINGAADVKERINRLSTVILNLETCSVNAASNSDVQNYSFNDGQSTISTNYRTISELASAIEAFEKIRERLINRCQGRVTILRDADVITRRWY
jgi:hypothetical protein